MPSLHNTKLSFESQLLLGKCEGKLACLNSGRIVYVLIDEEDREKANEVSSNWYSASNGYAYTFLGNNKTGQRKIYLHRVLMDASETDEVDHINRDATDNRRSNLRIVDSSANVQNRGKRKDFDGFIGVSFVKHCSKWRARLYKDGSCVFYKMCSTEIEAAAAYDKAALDFYGPDAMTNEKLGLLAADSHENANTQRVLPKDDYVIVRPRSVTTKSLDTLNLKVSKLN